MNKTMNKEIKHTRGPWMAHKDLTITTGDGTACIAHVIGPDEDHEVLPAQAAADAKLIAAAPEQYAILVEALDLVPRIDDNDPMAPALADWCRRVKALIG